MTRKKSGLVATLSLFFLLAGCSNILTPTANKETDEALYEDATKLMDAGDYSGAVAKFNAMGTGFTENVSVKEHWAGALAGECGLNFINYTQQLSSASLSGSTFFKYLMGAWTGVAVNPDSCRLAELKIKEIWVSSAATPSQQLFMAILSMAKIGTYLRSKADNAENSGLGDGTVDASYDSCSNSTPASNLTDAEAREVVTGFSLFLQNIVAFSSSLSSDLSNVIPTITTACSLMTPNPCATTESTNVDDSMVNSIRDILKSSALGIESCVNPLMTACCPPDPN